MNVVDVESTQIKLSLTNVLLLYFSKIKLTLSQSSLVDEIFQLGYYENRLVTHKISHGMGSQNVWTALLA